MASPCGTREFALALLLLPALVASLGQRTGTKYELKFQSELDNSTVTKLSSQQQIFKCQVRLAQVNAEAGRAANGAAPRLHSVSSALTEPTNPRADNQRWPANVSLAIEWLRDGAPLMDVHVVNVELRNGSAERRTKYRHTEIKNTLNSAQFKLTSRLRINNLQVADAGLYRCVARTKFIAPQAAVGGERALAIFEQTLNSNGANLIVANATFDAPGDQRHALFVAKGDGMVGPLDAPRPFTNESRSQAESARSANKSPSGVTSPSLNGTMPWQLVSSATARQDSNSKESTNQPTLIGQFEDDEDLFGLKAESSKSQKRRLNFISNTNRLSAGGPATNDAEDDTEEDTGSIGRGGPLAAGDLLDWSDNEPTNSNNNESSPANANTPSQIHSRAHDQNLFSPATPTTVSEGTESPSTRRNAHQHLTQLDGQLFEATRSKLAKFVQRIVPDLSCYSGAGEHYRGLERRSNDGRVCLNWLGAARGLRTSAPMAPSSNRLLPKSPGNVVAPHWTYAERTGDHNFCRNPNADPRGPWCYVSQLEAAEPKPPAIINQQFNIVVAYCDLSPCSDYLWFYIVAPSLGLLTLVGCLLSLLVRGVRYLKASRQHYISIGPPLPRTLNKVLAARGKFSSKSAKVTSVEGETDEDIFEIVRGIDWSDSHSGRQQAHSQSLSPKSITTESLKLSSSTSPSPRSGSQVVQNLSDAEESVFSRYSSGLASHQLASKLGGGPRFATLRCQARNSSRFASGKAEELNKSSSFVRAKPCGDTAISNNSWASTVSKSPVRSPSSRSPKHECQLIPSSSSVVNLERSSKSTHPEDNCIAAIALPAFDPSRIVLADQEPIYEGKFSVVRFAQMKQVGDWIQDQADIGAQVAIFSLKGSTDCSLFEPERLKLRQLNHLNIIKLIGVAVDYESRFTPQNQTSCWLIYDMCQSVDLNDWLRQQSTDKITASGGPSSELSLRRNLTCLAKQIALALDYLHSQGIVYRDLACRNCFIDATKLHVKLASFNIQLPTETGVLENLTTRGLRSMIRPKYLLDYYVIDARPADSQLLPLSWIPLESILFNKFNLLTDIWSYGCLLYELFSLGEVAFFGYSSKQVIDAIRSNLMPPQPTLCPAGIYRLMCKCLSDIPNSRPNIKQIYEQLNLHSGQCTSFLDHHLCSLSSGDLQQQVTPSGQCPSTHRSHNTCIAKTKSFASIKNLSNLSVAPPAQQLPSLSSDYDSPLPVAKAPAAQPEVAKIPSSKSINLCANAGCSTNDRQLDTNHYDEPVLGV